MTSDYYDQDEPMNRSPPMVPSVVKYGVDDDDNSRPPFVPKSEPPECDDKGTLDRSPRKPDHPETSSKTHYGDGLLIGLLGPDHPEVAHIARVSPLEISPKQGRGKVFDQSEWDHPPAPSIKPVPGTKEVQLKDQRSPIATSPSTLDSLEPALKPQSPETNTPLPRILPLNSNLGSPPQRRRFPSITAPPLPNLLPPHERRASLDHAPNPPPELKSRFSVPSLQPLPSIQSPPSSSAATSPETANNTPLPSISALGLNKSDVSPSVYNSFTPLSYAGPGVATPRESPLDRQLPSIVPPSSFAHYSPGSAISNKDASNNPSPASQPTSWRTPASAATPAGLPPPPPPPSLPPPPAPSEPPVPQSPYDMMSPMTAKSPATSYPTPTEQMGPGVGGQTTFSANMVPNGVPTGSGHYKCEHPGCTAAPFQTQYLLNSHANVHSQDRPHFCPVDGCPRGLGGKGFKRKNEMMRHGLVHNSPGYVCPFCPDQQHKYPRPDNLQRHVRVHHVDKSKDDPTLRQVLAQRPIGSTRGRRRRMNA